MYDKAINFDDFPIVCVKCGQALRNQKRMPRHEKVCKEQAEHKSKLKGKSELPDTLKKLTSQEK